MLHEHKRHQFGQYILALLLLVFSLLILFPIVWMLFSSLKSSTEILQSPPTFFPHKVVFTNFTNLIKRVNFLVFFYNSILSAALSTICVLYTSALGGYLFAKINFRGKEIWFTLILATMMIPWPVTIIPLFQLINWMHLADKLIAIIAPNIVSSFGIFMMRQFISTIPTELTEASRIDGAGEFTIFHRIIFPCLGSSLSALAIFTFLWRWDDFLFPFLVLSSKNKLTLPVGLSLFSNQYWTDYSGVLAGAVITILPVIIVYLFFQRQFIEGIALTGIKG